MKTRLDVSLRFHSSEMMDVRIPIEIRDEEMRLIARALSPATVEVESARYIVTATLPAGQIITRIVDAKGDAEHIVLEPRQEDQSPNEWQEIAHYAASKRAQRAATEIRPKIRPEVRPEIRPEVRPEIRPEVRPEIGRDVFRPEIGPEVRRGIRPEVIAEIAPEVRPEIPAPRMPAPGLFPKPQAWLRVFAGNLVTGPAVPQPHTLTFRHANLKVAQLSAAPANELRFLQCIQVGRPAINIALPASVRGCTVEVRREPERYWVEVYPDNSTANILLGYAQNNRAQQQASTAEGLLFDKVDDPIAASIGAYSLLRFGEIDRLHHWTQNLMELFLWLPDGAAIRGEHLARLGDHTGAAAAFLQVINRGLPVFSDGVKFTYERVRAYAEADSQIDDPIRAQAKQGLERLKPFVRVVDFTKSLTTFAGSDPAKPDNEPAQTPVEGMDLAALFPP